MAVQVPWFALCTGCGQAAQARCARCHAPVCDRCAAQTGCRSCVRTAGGLAVPALARRGHPNAFAHGLLTILWSAATLGFTFGLERDAAWTAFLLAPIVATLVFAVACARDVDRHGETFSFLVCLTAGIQIMRASQRGPDGLVLLAAFVPFALALEIAQRRRGAWRRFVRYLALLLVPTLASRMLLAGQAPLAMAWAAVAIALVV